MSKNSAASAIKPRQYVFISFAAAIETVGLYHLSWPFVLLGLAVLLMTFPQDHKFLPVLFAMIHKATAPAQPASKPTVTTAAERRKPLPTTKADSPRLPAPVEPQQLKQAG